MRAAGLVLTALAALSSLAAALLVLRMPPAHYQESYDGGELPRFVGAQRPPAFLALLAAFLTLVGTVLLALD